jgi:hypothetical protein
MILRVADEFDQWHGVSVGLVAWELGVTEASITAAFAAAITGGLLRDAARDEMHSEDMWRLTDLGRETLTQIAQPCLPNDGDAGAAAGHR